MLLTADKFLAAGLDAACPLPAIGVILPLSEIYDGVTFPPRLRIVLQ